MKTRKRISALLTIATSVLALCLIISMPIYAAAETAYWDGANTTVDADGGSGTWDTTTSNWDDAATSGNNIVWDANSSGDDTAVLDGAGGTVTLDQDIDLLNLQINNRQGSTAYTLSGNSLDFATGGTISWSVVGAAGNFDNIATITSGITGSPDIVNGGDSDNQSITIAPAVNPAEIGDISGNSYVDLAGVGGTLESVTDISKTRVQVDAGTWTITGFADTDQFQMNSGVLILSTGTLETSRGTIANGTLHLNNAAALKDGASSGKFKNHEIRGSGGASLDNTSGGAITTSTYNPRMNWFADWTFLGSNGAASDLYLGTGTMTLFNDIQVTVQNAATTLGVGGAIAESEGSHSLTKAGAGTLALSGNSSYTGGTIVDAGTLLINNTSGSGTGSGAVTVNGGTLGGTGTISGLVTVEAGGTVSPGASIGILTADGGMSLAGTSLFEIQGTTTPGTDFDQIGGTGLLTFQPGSQLLVQFLNSTPMGGSIPIFDFGSYAGPSPLISVTSSYGSVSFDELTGVLTFANAAIPEPSSVMLLTGLLAGLAALRRRRG